jgi:hypothetical protein
MADELLSIHTPFIVRSFSQELLHWALRVRKWLGQSLCQKFVGSSLTAMAKPVALYSAYRSRVASDGLRWLTSSGTIQKYRSPAKTTLGWST